MQIVLATINVTVYSSIQYKLISKYIWYSTLVMNKFTNE